ncbi:MAG: DUF3237 domain-containing protein [Thermoplasmata archaeon]|nr:DUF3237 domain-containing protein [Thermoplasmata archaeon]
MQLKPLYRLQFVYPRDWEVDIAGPGGHEQQVFLLAEGTVEGRLQGRFHGANYPRRRTDRTAVTDLRGAIECSDGATVLVEYRGFGRAHTPEYDRVAGADRREWVATAFHLSDHENYRWLNDVVGVGTGHVGPPPSPADPPDPRAVPGPQASLLLDVAELVWEPAPPAFPPRD